MTDTKAPYQPDPALVRECAARIIEGQIEEIRDLGRMDIGEMCEDEIVAIQEPLGGWDAPGASDAADALIGAVRKDIKAAVISHAWPGAAASADITVTTVRKALIAESHGHRAARRYSPLLKAGQSPTRAGSDALEGQSAAAAYSYLLAAVLRQIEAFSGTAEATEMARLCSAVMENGTEVLEDANSDLDEQTRADGALAVGMRVRVNRPGGPYDGRIGSIALLAPYGQAGRVGVAIDGREGVNVFPADDVTVLPREAVDANLDRMTPQTCPAGVHADWAVDSEYDHACPWCQIAGLRAKLPGTAGPTPEDIEAALDAKAEDDQIEAGRVGL